MPVLGFAIIFYVWISLQSNAKILGFCWLGIGAIYCLYKTKFFKVKPPVFME